MALSTERLPGRERVGEVEREAGEVGWKVEGLYREKRSVCLKTLDAFGSDFTVY